MTDKKQESFTVTDRRLFTSEGDIRKEAPSERVSSSAAPAAPEESGGAHEQNMAIPAAPTAAEQREQADAYEKSSSVMDERVGLGARSARDLEITFERFLASLYMTAMVQLGLMHEEGGQPRLDIVAARQTIDTLSLLSERTKGNLTKIEQDFLQNCLYELRMAYVEVTNALARPPETPLAGTGTTPR
jgi:hypothetical protein